MDKLITIKLISGEEIICTYIQETEYEVSIMFPMLVKSSIGLNRSGKLMESMSLAPYSYFTADDEYTFNKHHIVFSKDLNPNFIDLYNQTVDEFINANTNNFKQPTVDDMKDTLDKIQEVFNLKEDYDEFYNEPPTKTLH